MTRQRLTAVSLLLSAFVVLVVASYILEQIQHSRQLAERQRFEQQCSSYTSIYKQGLSSYIQHLRTTRSLFYANSHVLREEFALFVKEIIEVYPEIRAIEWVPQVLHIERESFEKRMHNSGFEQSEFIEYNAEHQRSRAADRDAYYPVYFVEPLAENLSVLGYDLGSNPVRLQALMQARDTGQPIASGRISLVQGKHNDNGILIIVPVYQTRDIPATLDDRLAQLSGFILGAFHIEDSIRNFSENMIPQNVQIEITDVSESQPVTLFTRKPQTTRDTETLLHSQQSIRFAGRHWQLAFSVAEGSIYDQAGFRVWVTVISAGLIIVLLLTLAVVSWRRQGRVTRNQSSP